MLVVSKIKELCALLNISWCGPGSDRSNLVQVNMNSTIFNNVTKILHTTFSKLTFSSLSSHTDDANIDTETEDAEDLAALIADPISYLDNGTVKETNGEDDESR